MLVVVLLVVPMLQNIYYSFFDWDGLSKPVFIGVKNFISLFQDSVLAGSMLNTVIWVVFTLVFPVLGRPPGRRVRHRAARERTSSSRSSSSR